MRHRSSLCVLMMLGASGASAGEPGAPIAQCIRDNAAKVEAAIPSLNDAADFLANRLCGGYIADEARKQQEAAMDRMLDEQKKACAARKPDAAAKPEDEYDPCQNIDAQKAVYSGFTIYGVGRQPDDPDAMALAAQLLLELRLAHMKASPR